MMAAEAQKKTLITSCPKRENVIKVSSIRYCIGHFCRVCRHSTAHRFFNQGTPLTPFYPENIIPVFQQKRKGKYGIYSALVTFWRWGSVPSCYARPFCRLKAPLGLSLFCFAPQTRICQHPSFLSFISSFNDLISSRMSSVQTTIRPARRTIPP